MFAVLVCGLPLLGCEAETPADLTVDPSSSLRESDDWDDDDDEDELRTYRVTVYNLTSTQPLTPPLVATHEDDIRLFRVGRRATEGVKEIAENGNLGPLNDTLMADDDVNQVVIAAGNPPPLLQNQSITFEIQADEDARLLSWISMLICTNDGFTGRNRIRLPRGIGQVRTAHSRAYDAGTEINMEDFADLVPPCQIFGATSSEDEGTGMSDPELAENGRIRRHRGIRGGDDLDPGLHGWTNPVAKVEVEHIN